MKMTTLFLLLFPVFAAADGLEQYSRKLIKALQNASPTSYIETFPERQELNKFLCKKLTGDSINVPEVVNDSTYQQILAEQRNKFTQIINKGDSLGIDWEKAAYLSHDIYYIEDEDSNVKMYKGSITFWDGDLKYKLLVRDIYQFASGYAGEVRSIEKIIPLPDELKK